MLKIDIKEKDKTVIISISGELSLSNVDAFDHSFKKYVNADLDVVALDLKDVSYLDSFAISRIIKISRNFIGSNTEFVLVNMNDDIHRVFKIATFDRLFNIMTIEKFIIKYLQGDSSSNS